MGTFFTASFRPCLLHVVAAEESCHYLAGLVRNASVPPAIEARGDLRSVEVVTVLR